MWLLCMLRTPLDLGSECKAIFLSCLIVFVLEEIENIYFSLLQVPFRIATVLSSSVPVIESSGLSFIEVPFMGKKIPSI